MADPVAGAKNAVGGLFNLAAKAAPLVGIAGLVCIAGSDMGLSGYAAAATEGAGNYMEMVGLA